jgi:chromosome segregation ATPase
LEQLERVHRLQQELQAVDAERHSLQQLLERTDQQVGHEFEYTDVL